MAAQGWEGGISGRKQWVAGRVRGKNVKDAVGRRHRYPEKSSRQALEGGRQPPWVLNLGLAPTRKRFRAQAKLKEQSPPHG